MPQDNSDLLQLLIQGRQPDPAGALYGQAFLEGKLPGDPVVNLHTALSMLSPGPIAERRAAEPGFGELLGLTEEEESRFTRQAVGLELSPAQEAMLGIQKTQAAAQLMQNFLEAGFKEREVSVKEREAGVKEKELDRKTKESEAQAEHLRALTSAMTELGELRRQTRLARQLAVEGVDAQGNPIDPMTKQLLAAVADVNLYNPGMLGVVRSLLANGSQTEREWAAKTLSELTGIDTTGLADPVGAMERFSNWVSGIFGAARTPEELGIPQGPGASPEEVGDSELRELEKRANERTQLLIDALKNLEKE